MDKCELVGNTMALGSGINSSKYNRNFHGDVPVFGLVPCAGVPVLYIAI
jgi:hypothetical protein